MNVCPDGLQCSRVGEKQLHLDKLHSLQARLGSMNPESS